MTLAPATRAQGSRAPKRVAEVTTSESAKTVQLEKLLAQEIATEQVQSNPPLHTPTHRLAALGEVD